MNIIEKTFDEYADSYQDKFNNAALGIYQRQRVHAEILPYLERAKCVLDIGCGPGSDFEFYKALHLQVEAIDISSQMVQLARRKSEELRLYAHISKTSIEEYKTITKYDAVVMNFGVINVIERLDETLLKMKALLKEDGTCLIVSMPPFHLFSFLSSLIKLNLQQILTRILKKRATLANGLKIFYHSQNDFAKYFTIAKKVNLCSILPTPDQYRASFLARIYSSIFIRIDARISHSLPDIFGGDHVLYIAVQKSLGRLPAGS